jgi:hypothetical protein
MTPSLRGCFLPPKRTAMSQTRLRSCGRTSFLPLRSGGRCRRRKGRLCSIAAPRHRFAVFLREREKRHYPIRTRT